MIGAVLAGGAGSRMGGAKPTALLGGKPLISYPLAALAEVCDRVAVVCKTDTELPQLGESVERWDEPAEPRHPLTGIVHALETARAPVLVCAVDMPFVTPDACRSLLEAGNSSPAVVATAGGRLQPVFGLYAPAALERLRAAPPDASLTATVETLGPARLALPQALVVSVDTAEALADAERRLAEG